MDASSFSQVEVARSLQDLTFDQIYIEIQLMLIICWWGLGDSVYLSSVKRVKTNSLQLEEGRAVWPWTRSEIF